MLKPEVIDIEINHPLPQMVLTALVDLARFERATSTFAESRSDSVELQVRIGAGIPARSQRPVFPGTEPTRCKVYGFGLRQWRRWSDSNAHRISPGTLAGCCHAS